MKRHGGARVGAGRPCKWSFEDVLNIGHACERRWHAASEMARDHRLAALPHAEKIAALQRRARDVPVRERKEWLRAEYADHSGDIEAWLHARAGTAFNEETLEFEGPAQRGVTVSTKPFRGTRQRIIAEVALETGVSESAVDNLWQAYRRLQRELSETSQS